MKPYYQSGLSSVEHRNLDAAGDGHPFGDSPKEFTADMRPLIRQVADDLYDSWEAGIREYLANAETACLKVQDYLRGESPFDDLIVSDGYQPTIEVTWNKAEQNIVIKDNGIGMAGVEVDQVFRHIGRSAARDLGTRSGAFGMGALSFFKIVGTNSSMIMVSHSRLNDDNGAYLISLAGVEPVMGELPENEYGTKFTLTQKNDDMNVRQAVERYAEWMRVPVIYRELDENKEEVFNEDYGDSPLYEQYDETAYMDDFCVEGAFNAYTVEGSNEKTLLLSMEIDRNFDERVHSPYNFDVRILDESGKVIRSSNGNEGLMPISQMQYNKMLLQARSDFITDELLSNEDVTAFETSGSGDYIIKDEILEAEDALPIADYVRMSDANSDDIGQRVVVAGPHMGRQVIEESEWHELPEGRAEQYVVEEELEPYDLDSGEGDLCLPKPTTDRSSLQQNDVFWKFIARQFTEQHNEQIEKYRQELQSSDQLQALQEMEDKTIAGYKERNER